MKRMNLVVSSNAILLVTLVALAAWGTLGCGKKQAADPANPSPSSAGTPAAAESSAATAALCAQHGVSAALCFICDASLRESGRLWCAEHARYEDRCWLCHPDLRDQARLYCDEHGLYEDECFLCHPELKPATNKTAATDRSETAHPQPAGLACTEHGVPEAECGICHPELADRLQPGGGLKIRFSSPESAARAGVATSSARETRATGSVEAMGRLEFNQNRFARLAAPADGVVRRVHVDLGDRVNVGQVLVELSSSDWAGARADYLRASSEETTALAAFRREEDLHAKRVSSEQDLLEARTRYEAARAARRAAEETLSGLGLPRAELASGGEGSTGLDDGGSGLLALRAPFAGTIVARQAVVGEAASPGSPLIAVADLDPVWALLSVPEANAVEIRTGQPVELSTNGLRVATGRITWVANAIDPSTRMLELRAEVPNPAGTLRAGTFVKARILTGGDAAAVLVPTESVHRFGGNPFVFLELAADLFEIRRVALAGERDGAFVVTAGLTSGDRVVDAQSYLVKAEFQKSRLGAGCVD